MYEQERYLSPHYHILLHILHKRMSFMGIFFGVCRLKQGLYRMYMSALYEIRKYQEFYTNFHFFKPLHKYQILPHESPE